MKNSEFKFNVTTKQMRKDVNGYTLKVTVDNREQRFIVKTSEITKFTVKSTAALKYKLKGNKWKISSVVFGKGSIYSVRLKGTWNGTYVAGQGQTKARIVISEVSKDGYAIGTFYFSATPTNPRVPSGSYSIMGGYDKKTGKKVGSAQIVVYSSTQKKEIIVKLKVK